MRYRLLASAGVLGAAVLAVLAVPALPSARAAECGCAPAVRAALAREAPAVKKPRKSANSQAPRRRAAESRYDYGAWGLVDTRPYAQQWAVAPAGYVPAPAMDDAAYGPPPPPDAYGDNDQDGITIEQGGWSGGVGYTRAGGGGGGGGGGGEVLTLAQPDSLNGPNYNSFGESYGGDYQAANRIDAVRQQALAPPSSNSSSGTASH